MNLLKALLIGGLITLMLFVIVVWVIPVFTFLIIFAGISIIAYEIMKENNQSDRPL